MITYPVSPDSRWSVYSISQAKIIAENKTWPRTDGGPIEKQNPDEVPLLQVKTNLPVYDNTTQKAIHLPDVIDIPNNTITQAWSVVPLSAEDIQNIANQNTRQIELTQIKSAYLALKNGTGTTAERLTRCEKVLARILNDTYGP